MNTRPSWRVRAGSAGCARPNPSARFASITAMRPAWSAASSVARAIWRSASAATARSLRARPRPIWRRRKNASGANCVAKRRRKLGRPLAPRGRAPSGRRRPVRPHLGADQAASRADHPRAECADHGLVGEPVGVEICAVVAPGRGAVDQKAAAAVAPDVAEGDGGVRLGQHGVQPEARVSADRGGRGRASTAAFRGRARPDRRTLSLIAIPRAACPTRSARW